MRRSLPILDTPFSLDELQIASPCEQSWDDMKGDERARFCQSCSKNVYNLSGMTRAEAKTLLQDTEGRVCVRFYRRSDGTVLTSDCPVGFAAKAYARAKRTVFTGSAGLAAAFVVVMSSMTGATPTPVRRFQQWALQRADDVVVAPPMMGAPPPMPPPDVPHMMGDVGVPDRERVMGEMQMPVPQTRTPKQARPPQPTMGKRAQPQPQVPAPQVMMGGKPSFSGNAPKPAPVPGVDGE
jgi:hypothetical protein